MYTILDLTWPSGIPRAVFSSSERFPGFFSFSLVSNSFPYCIKNRDWMIKEHNSLYNIEINHTIVNFKYKYNPSTRNTCIIRILQTTINLSISLIFHNTSCQQRVLNFKSELLSNLIIEISMNGHFGFGLPSEEGIMEFLVIDVDFTHLGSHLLPHLSLQVLLIFLLKDIAYQHTCNTCVMELRLLYNQFCTSLSQHTQSIEHQSQKTFIYSLHLS